VAEGAKGADRSADDVVLATSVFVVSGGDEGDLARQRESVRSQIGFYASTPTYRTVLEAHGWEPVGERLGLLAREKRWGEMPALVTDEMLRAFAVEAPPEELGRALEERYAGLIDRVALYVPLVPGERDDFWRKVVGSLSG
jgi:alkanesulfonate monooxygenase SsuD/methylene tetrahydromethanopterin reductase-like flavin-dependent oxidoreductase (luciferase family)